jgi:hypothetical protein
MVREGSMKKNKLFLIGQMERRVYEGKQNLLVMEVRVLGTVELGYLGFKA